MQLSFAEPCPALASTVCIYYLFEIAYSKIDDVQRADVGHLRFFMEGEGHQNFASGKRLASHPVFLTGPSNQSSSFSVAGPLRFLGVGLLPQAWGGLLNGAAGDHADDAINGAALLDAPPEPLIEQLRQCTTITEMKPLLDTFLTPLIKTIPHDHSRVNETIRQWLSDSLFPDVDALYAQCALSERQVTRIANRYWGGPPKTLARKYGALRTASHIVMHEGEIPDEATAHYADRSHLIREVKRVTAQTPRHLRTVESMIMRVTLHPSNFRELLPRT